VNLWVPDKDGHDAIGELPPDVSLGLIPSDGELPPEILDAELLVPPAGDERVLELLGRMPGLRAGRVRAALDVTDPEPLPADHPLWDAPGTLITPHIAGDTLAAQRRAFALVGEQVGRYVRGEPLTNVVEHGY
jgi:hypothetical protein